MLNISSEYRHGILFIRLQGELTKKTIQKFYNQITRRITSGGIRYMVFNISELKSIDKTGINYLVNSSKISIENDGCVFMCGVNNKLKKELENEDVLEIINEVSNELVADKLINMRVR